MGKKCYAIQLQTGEMYAEKNPEEPGRCVTNIFNTISEARKANILLHGTIGTLTVGVKEYFKPLDKNDIILRARELLLKLGAEITPDKYHAFKIKTRYGTLGINLHIRGKYRGASGPGDFMCQFDEAAHAAAKASGLFPGMGCSGKWNHHYFGEVTVDEVIADMECKLRAIGAG